MFRQLLKAVGAEPDARQGAGQKPGEHAPVNRAHPGVTKPSDERQRNRVGNVIAHDARQGHRRKQKHQGRCAYGTGADRSQAYKSTEDEAQCQAPCCLLRLRSRLDAGFGKRPGRMA